MLWLTIFILTVPILVYKYVSLRLTLKKNYQIVFILALCLCILIKRKLMVPKCKIEKKNLDLFLTELTLPQHSLRKVGGMRYKHKMFKRSDKICHVMHAWLFSISFLRGRLTWGCHMFTIWNLGCFLHRKRKSKVLN